VGGCDCRRQNQSDQQLERRSGDHLLLRRATTMNRPPNKRAMNRTIPIVWVHHAWRPALDFRTGKTAHVPVRPGSWRRRGVLHIPNLTRKGALNPLHSTRMPHRLVVLGDARLSGVRGWSTRRLVPRQGSGNPAAWTDARRPKHVNGRAVSGSRRLPRVRLILLGRPGSRRHPVGRLLIGPRSHIMFFKP